MQEAIWGILRAAHAVQRRYLLRAGANFDETALTSAYFQSLISKYADFRIGSFLIAQAIRSNDTGQEVYC